MLRFSVTYSDRKIQIYKMTYPMLVYSPSIICQTSFLQEYTIYKYVSDDDEVFKKIAEVYDRRLYHSFILHEDCHGIDHVGIVHFISGLFSKKNIPILYINTYAYNVIFVCESYIEQALKIIKENPQIDLENFSILE